MTSPVSSRPGLGSANAAILLLLLCLSALAPGTARGAARSRSDGEVLTYFNDVNRGGHVIMEWRIFDPVTRKDELFRAHDQRPGGIQWDSTWSNVEYAEGGAIRRLEWEMDAQPWPMRRLPPTDCLRDWWFNPDRGCWQAASGAGVSRNYRRNEPPYARCHHELWQSDRDGIDWRITQAETTDCGGCFFCESWTIPDTSAIRRDAAIGFDQLAAEMSIDGWGGAPELLPPWLGETSPGFDWYFIPFRGAADRGISMRIGRREHYPMSMMAPLYLIDRKRGTRTPLDLKGLAQDQPNWRLRLAMRGDYLLVTGGPTWVFDVRSGEEIFRSNHGAWRSAVWVKPPRPAAVDGVGLRRLSERFR